NTSLINLHLATGQIGKPGAGPFSLTGQPNAMGGREVGGLATLLPAHRELSNPQHVAEMAKFWGVKQISNQPGASATELFTKLLSGDIKAVYIACTNPAHSMPNSERVKRALEKAELVVVQDAYLSPATVGYADIVFPASTWAEKEGTVTNSERRISRVRSALPAPGHARPDWQIAADFGQCLAKALKARAVKPRNLHGPDEDLLRWESVQAVFEEHRALTRGRDLDITGLSYDLLEQAGPQQWPLPEGGSKGAARLYEDGRFQTPSGKARFVLAQYVPVAEDANSRFPWRLNTGRLRDQWHGASRTGTLPQLFSHEGEPVVSLNPADISRLGLCNNDWVELTSKRGRVSLKVKPSDEVEPNQAWLPMHWGPEFLGGRGLAGGVNSLTCEAFDPYSKQPELKHAAIQVSPLRKVWQVVVFAESEQFLMLWLQARSLFGQFESASCIPVGRDRPGVLFRAMSHKAPASWVIQKLEELFGLRGSQVMAYSDPTTGENRKLRVEFETSQDRAYLTAVMLAGSVVSEPWLRQFFESRENVIPHRSALLKSQSKPPVAGLAPVKMICNCVGVSQESIQASLLTMEKLSEAEKLQRLKYTLKCGTECGSCVPEIRGLIQQATTLQA
ncbi:MAG: molybdopterin-dependent oxidoreductase, partial [Limnobacter sp.]|nr:molybdopterin-dependent oxidoreductase [Limnobacter sp.]